MAILTTATAKNQDIGLLRTFANGNDFEAFASIVNRHAGMVFETGKRLTGNEADAEEVAKVCFRELSKLAASIEVPPVVWLHRTATAEAKRIVALRKKKGAKAEATAAESPAAAAAASGAVAATGEQEAWQQLLGMMDESIDELPENSREVLLLQYLEGRSAEQIAGEAGIDLAVVKQRVWGALNDLWPVMVRRGFCGTIQTMQGMLAAQRAGTAPQHLLATLGNLAVSDAFWSQFLEWAQNSAMAKVIGAVVLALVVGSLWYTMSKHRPSEAKAQAVAKSQDREQAGASPALWQQTSGAQHGAIEGVPALRWGQSGQTTFCGALAAALAPQKEAPDYATLMGVSGLAFRTRWYHGNDDRRFAGVCAVGEQVEERTRVGRAIGKTLEAVWLFGANNPKRPALMQRICASIDQRRPVLTYVAPHLDMAVIYGYENHGKTFLVRDYYDEMTSDGVASTRVGGFYIFLKDPADSGKALSAVEALSEALSAAVANFSRVDHPSFDEEKGSVFFYGAEAYAQWTADIEQAGDGKLSRSDQKKLFDAGNWNFSCLSDARRAAVAYLKASSQRPGMSAAAKESLLRAAGIYEREILTMARSWQQKDLFLGSWTGKAITDWTPEVRGREIAMLRELEKQDEAAIGELKNASAAISMTK